MKNKRSGYISAKELMEELRRNPEYVSMEKEREKWREIKIKEFREAAAPVFKELEAAGYPKEVVTDHNFPFTYKGAVPILMKWVPKMENARVKEAIVRTLTVKWAKPVAARLMIEEFKKESDPERSSLRWAIGNALSVVADDNVIDDIITIIKDKEQYGHARQMVILALANMKDPRAVDVLIDCVKADDFAGIAIEALGKLKAKKAKHVIEPFINNSDTWVRNKAKRALAKIDKAIEKAERKKK